MVLAETIWIAQGISLLISLIGMLTLLFLLVGGVTVVELSRWSRAVSSADTSVCQRTTLRDTPAYHAEALLRDVLDAQEYEQLTKRAYIEVTSPTDPGRVYRIPRSPGLVRVYDHGVAVRDLCIQPVDYLPSADVIAMHKLMIQGAEHEYLARARHFTIM